MHIYDTLIIGCGYSSVGFALARKNCVICEENQICDTHFYLPLKSFRYQKYVPQTSEGTRLFEIFSDLSLFVDDKQNTNGFECGFCKYLMEKSEEILLKCRIVKINETDDGIYDVTVQTNEGLSHLFAKNILKTLGEPKAKYFTILFTTEDIIGTSQVLTHAFHDSHIEPAFYEGRYALHIPADGYNENDIKVFVYQKWCELAIDAKIVYMAPVFAQINEGADICDDMYNNPIEAFEAGFFYAEEAKK